MSERFHPSPRVPALSIWVIYDHPKDEPDTYIARHWEIVDGRMLPTRETITCNTVDAIRGWLRDAGLTRFSRSPGDDPVILECWL